MWMCIIILFNNITPNPNGGLVRPPKPPKGLLEDDTVYGGHQHHGRIIESVNIVTGFLVYI